MLKLPLERNRTDQGRACHTETNCLINGPMDLRPKTGSSLQKFSPSLSRKLVVFDLCVIFLVFLFL